MRARPERLRLLIRRHVTGAVFLGAFVIATAIYAGPSVTDLAHRCLPTCTTDADIYAWSFRWMLEALSKGLSPLRTPLIGAPEGLHLTWITTVIAPALVMAPVTAAVGAYPSVALSKLLAIALSATAAFALGREITHRTGPSLVGAALFAFGSYTSIRLMHLNLLVVFPIPLIVVQALRLQRGAITDRQYVTRVAALLTFQFYTSTETFATAVMFGALALLLYRWRVGAIVLRGHVVRSSAIALIVAGVLASPFLVDALRNPPARPAYELEDRSAVLADFLIPSRYQALGAPFLGLRASLGFGDDPRGATSPMKSAREGYLGPVLLAALLGGRATFRRIRFPLAWFMGVVAVLSLGPTMRLVPGLAAPPGPGWLVERLPVFGLAFPNRFPLYLWLAIAVFAAVWAADPPAWLTSRRRLAAGLLCVATLAPGTDASAPLPAIWPTYSPSAIRDGTVAWFVAPEDIVLARGLTQQSLRWQVDSGMGFRMTDGYLGPYTPWFRDMPTRPDLVPSGSDLAASLVGDRVRWVMFAGLETRAWARLLSNLTRWPPVRYGDLVLWDASAISGVPARVEPPSSEAQRLFRHGRALQRDGMLTEAATMYRRVIELRPRNRWAHFALGTIYERYADEERAALHYQAALSSNPRYVAPLVALARLWRSVGFDSGALVAFERLDALRPDLLTADERAFLDGADGAGTS